MKTSWDYSGLAESYVSRPQYSEGLIRAIFQIASMKAGMTACDVGAGVGHLTRHHVASGHSTTAVEPNDDMRRVGQEQMPESPSLTWVEGTGEATGQADKSFDLVTFGSSFNVCDRESALVETARILKPSGWFACLWNHRDLTDPIQGSIEKIISDRVPEYSYGSRREDQSQIIRDSQKFSEPIFMSSRVAHQVPYSEFLTAWRSHATLKRQSGTDFDEIVSEIEDLLMRKKLDTSSEYLIVPYTTTVWVAQLL
jgi:ubiquinone/menaquinone biosynthesis C-methylase UbiE